MKLSVVIATLDRPADLERALRSVLAQTVLPDEVWVIDQSADDASRRVVDALDPAGRTIRHVRRPEKSLVKARNAGLEASRGELVSFLDDDVELSPDYYEKVLKAFEAGPRVGGIGGSVVSTVEPRGWKWAARRGLRRVFLLTGRPGRMTASGFGFPVYERPIARPIDVEMLHGCNMTFRREAIGAERFDEWFAGYGFREDAEFSYRISRRWTLRMVPEARLKHFESPAGRLDTDRLKRMEMRNYDYVCRKHRGGGPLARLLFAWSSFGVLTLDTLDFVSRRDELKKRRWRSSMSAFADLWRRK